MTFSAARLICLGLIVALAFVVGFLVFTPAEGVRFFTMAGYSLIASASVLFAWFVVKSVEWRTVFARWRSGGWRAVLAAVVLSGLLHLRSEHRFHILMDEVMLSATAAGMHRERTPTYVERGVDLAGDFHVLETNVDKRPLLFPFLLSVVHDLTGFRVANVFWLNALLTPLLLLLVHAVARRLAGEAAGWVAMLAWATLPLFALAAASGGFELLNLVMLALTLWLGMHYAERPDDTRLSAFVLSGVLLAQTRYESALMVLPVAVVVAWVWCRERVVRLPWPVLLSPVLMLPVPLQLNVFKANPTMWQTGSVPSESGVFSPTYWSRNLGHALNHFLILDGTQANSILLTAAWLALVVVVPLLLVRRVRAWFGRPDTAVFLIFGAGLFLLGALLLGYFWGRFDDWVTTRLSLPLQLGGVWAGVLALSAIRTGSEAWWRWVAAASVATLFLWTMPLLSKGLYARQSLTPKVAEWQHDFASAHRMNGVLVIDGRLSYQWLLHEVGATSLSEVMAEPDGFLFHVANGTYREVLLVQWLRADPARPDGWTVIAADEIGEDVALVETVDTLVLSPEWMVRIVRLRDIDAARFAEAAHRYTASRAWTQAATREPVTLESVRREQRWFSLIP